MITTTSNRHRSSMDHFNAEQTSQKGKSFARIALPLASAIGYTVAITALFIRATRGEEEISASTVQRCVAGAAAPTLIAAGATGWEALKQIGARKYEDAKKIFRESIQPGGLISDVVFPKKEFEILGRAAMDMEMAQAVAADPSFDRV